MSAPTAKPAEMKSLIVAMVLGTAAMLAEMPSLSLPTGVAAEEEIQRRVVFREGFESDGKIRPWASNGAYNVHFADVTEQRAASGKRSFKIDVTWKDCSYNYWQAAPLLVPYYGSPRITGKLYAERERPRRWDKPKVLFR